MEEFAIEVIACTIPDWPMFISAAKEIYAESPTRDLDTKRITVGDPGSFAMALEVINNRREAVGDLSKAYRSLDFVSFVMIAYLKDIDEHQGFCNLLDIEHLQYADKSGGSVILAGSVKQYKNLINFGCQIPEYRPLFNKMHSLLCKFGFSTLFGMKKGLPDGTFLLT